MIDEKWHQFVLRTQITMRMQQLGMNERVRARIVEALSKVASVTRLTAFARYLESKSKPHE